MDLNKLRIFKTVVATGSVTKAAEELHLAQPYVSRVIGELETECGHELFEKRNGRRTVKASKYGVILHNCAENIFESIDSAFELMERLSSPEGGWLTITLCTELPNLKAVIDTFRQQHPQVRIRFGQNVTQEPRQKPIITESDLIISAELEPQKTQRLAHLFRDHIVIVLPESHADIHSLLDIAHLKFFLPSKTRQEYRNCESVFSVTGIKPAIVAEASSAGQMLSMVAATEGVEVCALWSELDLQNKDLTGVRLVRVPDFEAVRWINLAWPTNTPSAQLIELLAAHLLESYQQD